MSWFSPKLRVPLPEVRMLREPEVGFCGVCARYGAQNHVHAGLSDDGRDCELQVRNPVLLCLECLDEARWASEVLRADEVHAPPPLASYQLRACVLGFERSGARRDRQQNRRRN